MANDFEADMLICGAGAAGLRSAFGKPKYARKYKALFKRLQRHIEDRIKN